MAETMSSNSCRICMSSKMHHSSIFSNDLSRKITEIADVEVQEGDGLPPTICEDCEVDLDKCYKFRVQIQWADSKFRENLSVSEVVFEECQIKQEIAPMHPFMNEDNQDNEDDDDDRGPSDNDDDDYDMREEPEDKTENADKEGNQVTHPLDHVEIIENRTKQEIHMPLTDQNSQEEPLIVAQNMKSENEPTTDPLMHNEPQSMETDNILPGPSTSAPMVYGSEHPIRFLEMASPMNILPHSMFGPPSIPFCNNLQSEEAATCFRPFKITLPDKNTGNSIRYAGPNPTLQIITTSPNVTNPLSNVTSQPYIQFAMPGQNQQIPISSSRPNLPFQLILPGQNVQVPLRNAALRSQVAQSSKTTNFRPRMPLIILLPNKPLPISGARPSVPPYPQAPSLALGNNVNLKGRPTLFKRCDFQPSEPARNPILEDTVANQPDKKDSPVTPNDFPCTCTSSSTTKQFSEKTTTNLKFGSTGQDKIECFPKHLKKSILTGPKTPARNPSLKEAVTKTSDGKTSPTSSKDDRALLTTTSDLTPEETLIKSSLSRNMKKRTPKILKKTYFVTELDIKRYKAHNDTTCFVCNKKFDENDLLLEHLKEKSFFCRVCTDSFDNHSDLVKHFTNHNGQKCMTCKEVFFCRRDQIHHFKTNVLCNKGGERFPCDQCKKTYSNVKLLKLHKREKHAAAGTKKHQCIVCNEGFNLFNTLTLHLQASHSAYEYISCNLCNKVYLGPEKLKAHVKNQHLKLAKRGQFECKKCKAGYSNESSYINHIKKHEGEGLCVHCGETISGGSINMQSHVYNKHSGRSLTCRKCLQDFNTIYALRKHSREHHQQSLPDRKCCELCGKQFKNAQTLKHHYRTHSDERNFKCDVCGATFKQKVALFTHSRIHSNKYKFSCDKCGKGFRWKQTFDKHVAKCTSTQSQSDSDE